VRRKLTPVALLAAAVLGLAGCSSATPLSGPSGAPSGAVGSGSVVDGTSQSAPGPADSGVDSSAPSSGGGASFAGLSRACTAALKAQVAIATLFSGALETSKSATLTDARVSGVFDTLGSHVPNELSGEVSTLRDAAQRSVGKSAVDVAEILQDEHVADARAALATYVRNCSPPTT